MLEEKDAAELTADFTYLEQEEQHFYEMMERAMTNALTKVASQIFKKE